jgi:hypothetical protein
MVCVSVFEVDLTHSVQKMAMQKTGKTSDSDHDVADVYVFFVRMFSRM